ncbi:MAG: hypothetical protein QF921_16235 [Pseudomonadales bacterium]|jgi:hypothetical protein|nr:hypothetical protein [Pseudomonadales bacterium]MDP6469632.1 hypothetical protein [Pseudomonadales bacterium]MDP6827473.1 hypothetical protein [Pseudomonadales bacterium]MDP6973033.1 hypothetical protein [Pseudomonadales bacterium]|tara:strand:- start:2720 stop:3076 length:357 start_codon:yes stop_codon:yes gene_type:complete
MNDPFASDISIAWYRSPIDDAKLSCLLQRSNLRGALQTLCHLGWFFFTGLLTYQVFLEMDSGNLPWSSVPLLIAVLFLHGTMGPCGLPDQVIAAAGIGRFVVGVFSGVVSCVLCVGVL